MISVIMPVFNGEKTVQQAIRSAAYNRVNERIEVIVVDDGSTDRTSEILRELQAEISNLHVARQRNMGPGVARNTALKQAKGNFVVFLDADDYLEPTALEVMKKCMNDYDACMAGTRYLLGNIPISSGIECWHKLNKDVVNAWDDNFLVEITPAVRAKMFRREVLDGLEFPACKWEDLAFIPAALARAGRIAILDEPVYNYRIHLNATVKDFLFRCKVDDIFVALTTLERNLQGEMADNPQAQKYFQSILTLHTMFRMQNVMTWVGVCRGEKLVQVMALERVLATKYPNWKEDAVLRDPEVSYKDPFFRFMLRRLYKKYLN